MKSEQLSELYKIRFTPEELPRKNAIWRVLCDHFFKKFTKDSDVVVDVACGYGEFLNNIKAKEKIAIDLNPDAQNFLEKEIKLYICEAAHFSKIIQNKADIVFTSNFLEHLPTKQALSEFLEQVERALKPGGKYLILGPNLRYLPGEYWDFYDHHLGLTHLSLCEALRLHGFDIEFCIDKFLPYTSQGRLPSHPWLVWMYLKIPFVWRFLGKQFFIVARKKTL